MSRSIGTLRKYGWLNSSGSVRLKLAGLATMFFTACSLGT